MTGKFCIVISDPQTYVPGSTVSGNVAYHASRPEKTEGINIIFNGSIHCKWSAGSGSLYYNTGFEQIFLMEKNLLSHGGGTAVELQPGLHNYPFSFTLPSDIPSSFKGKHGKIKYKLTATMKRPHRFNNTCKLTICVKDFLDLNLLPAAGSLVTCQIQKSFSSLLLDESGSVKAILKMSKSGIVPGERVPITLYVDNESDSIINECNIYVVGVVRYQTSDRKHEVYDKAWKVLLGVMKNVLREEQRSVAAKIKIPKSLNLPATNFSSSSLRIISLDYYFEMEVKFESWAKDLKKKVPIIIGTLPVNRLSSTRYLDNSAERLQDSEPQERNDSNYQNRPQSQIPNMNQEQNMGNTSRQLDPPPPYENLDFEDLPPSYEEVLYW